MTEGYKILSLPEHDEKIKFELKSCAHLLPLSKREQIQNVVSGMSPLTRARIAKYPDGKGATLDWFNPTILTGEEPEDPKFNLDWWNKLAVKDKGYAEEMKTFYVRATLFGDQATREDLAVTYKPVDFYATLTKDTALDWYYGLPAHLRAKTDEEVKKQPNPRNATRKDNEALWDAVAHFWGDRPALKWYVEEEKGRVTSIEPASNEALEVYRRWGYEYQQETIRAVVLSYGPSIQRERKMLNEVMGLNVDSDGLPNQADGLDPTTAATVRWLQSTGELPLEFLAKTYRSEDAKMSDRLTAARTMMDFVHRRVPTKTETETKGVTEPKLSANVLKSLDAKELELLEKLLLKLSNNG